MIQRTPSRRFYYRSKPSLNFIADKAISWVLGKVGDWRLNEGMTL